MVAELTEVLSGRYKLAQLINSGATSSTYLGFDRDQSPVLVKLWPYQESGRPSDEARALWNAELRTLYRLGSSPRAQECLLTLRDAGVDRHIQAFVMVVESDSAGYQTISSALTNRSLCESLTLKCLRTESAREALWKGLQQVAKGIQMLHVQRMIHRNVTPESVFLDFSQGPSSMRLGGFEWSFRIGTDPLPSTQQCWTLPPEWSAANFVGHTFDSDWYGFGMLIARCFYSLESWSSQTPKELNRLVTEEITLNRGGAPLKELERRLILRLIDPVPGSRLTFADEITYTMGDIVRSLATGPSTGRGPLILIFNHNQEQLRTAALSNGFMPNPAKPSEVFSSLNQLHVIALKQFIQDDLKQPLISPTAQENVFLLHGERLVLKIGRFEDQYGPTWNAAFVIGPSELRGADPHQTRELGSVEIAVLTRREAANQVNRQNWEVVLPRGGASMALSAQLNDFHEFLRCTNQLELILRDAEIFPYTKLEDIQTAVGFECIRIAEDDSIDRGIPMFCRPRGGLVEFLQREIESNKPHCWEVALTSSDGFRISVKPEDWWTISNIDPVDRTIDLKRAVCKTSSPVLKSGFIRAYGLFGQLTLIERRKEAIDRLQSHSYLLRALAEPGAVCMETGALQLPYELPPSKVDKSKSSIMQDIFRVRPMYALQGPPGTGKTTLVAYLLREILEEDNVAQILVTAQAHGAVDVLRRKVRDEAFRDVRPEEMPLSVRLRTLDDQSGRQDENDESENPNSDYLSTDTVEEVSQRLLNNAQSCLENNPHLSEIQRRWLELITSSQMEEAPESKGFRADFQQLIKQSASITYCTTSAPDLADLVKGSNTFDWSFDWSIIEEAGKTHGFDLALPLQSGHRWLLLGDQKQLPPYRYADYLSGLNDLDLVADALTNLPDGYLVDKDWVREWKDREPALKTRFHEYARDRLRTFQWMFENLATLSGSELITTTESIGASTGRLSVQHRMHPTIGDLISNSFYDGAVANPKNDDGASERNFDHFLTCKRMTGGQTIHHKPIVWIDVAWCQTTSNRQELSGKGGAGFKNEREILLVKGFVDGLELTESADTSKKRSLALLSPYNYQVNSLNQAFAGIQPPAGLTLLESTSARKGKNRLRWAHTVDSFQGNQASTVIVSLVRNNTHDPEQGLGFLTEIERLNVMLSRAEQLLVLVGSWDFLVHQLQFIDPVREQRDNFRRWKLMMTLLEKYFAEGKAIRIPEKNIKIQEPGVTGRVMN